MDHDKNIHLNIYRQDILEISQILEKAQRIDALNETEGIGNWYVEDNEILEGNCLTLVNGMHN